MNDEKIPDEVIRSFCIWISFKDVVCQETNEATDQRIERAVKIEKYIKNGKGEL